MGNKDNSFRLVRYSHNGSPVLAGLLIGEQVLDLRETGIALSMEDVFSRWSELQPQLAALSASHDAVNLPWLAEVKLHAPVPFSGTVYCAGANYRDHIAEMARMRASVVTEEDRQPWHFIKPTRACLAGPGSIQRPEDCRQLDWEAELAVVIGREASLVGVDDALSYVACYTVSNDLSARDLFRRPSRSAGSPFHFDWIGHKGFNGSCPIGPWLTSAASIDPQHLRIQLSVNGEMKQDSNTSEMIFSVAQQIAHLSRRTTLFAGDVILTGTPAGVGSSRNEFLAPGDVVKVEIAGLGQLVNTISNKEK